MSSGPGDVGGEVSGDEAAWRELVARFDDPAEATAAQAPWPAREDLPESPVPPGDGPGSETGPGSGNVPSSGNAPTSPGAPSSGAGPADLPGVPIVRGDVPFRVGPYLPFDHAKIIRPAGDPRSYSPADEDDEDDRYVPVPLPPPAKLDPIAKAAWVAVIGGPGYLLVVSLFLHMAVSPTTAFVAVGAFVAGFVTLVMKLGDHSRRDDDDDGAVL